MPTVLPFRGLRYAPSLRKDLDRLIAPPYDVIDAERRRLLAARHVNNIVHLDLPEGLENEPPPRAASRLLARWRADSTLIRDDRPAFYLCEQRYKMGDGKERVRRGVFGRLRLPHQKQHRG